MTNNSSGTFCRRARWLYMLKIHAKLWLFRIQIRWTYSDIGNIQTELEKQNSDMDNILTECDEHNTDMVKIQTQPDKHNNDIDNNQTKLDIHNNDMDNIQTELDQYITDISDAWTKLMGNMGDVQNELDKHISDNKSNWNLLPNKIRLEVIRAVLQQCSFKTNNICSRCATLNFANKRFNELTQKRKDQLPRFYSKLELIPKPKRGKHIVGIQALIWKSLIVLVVLCLR